MESYQLRAAISAQYSRMQPAILLLAESPPALAACARLDGIEPGIDLQPINGGCRLLLTLDGSTQRIAVELTPAEDGTVYPQCLTDLPRALWPRGDCASLCDAAPDACSEAQRAAMNYDTTQDSPAGPDSLASAIALAAVGEIDDAWSRLQGGSFASDSESLTRLLLRLRSAEKDGLEELYAQERKNLEAGSGAARARLTALAFRQARCEWLPEPPAGEFEFDLGTAARPLCTVCRQSGFLPALLSQLDDQQFEPWLNSTNIERHAAASLAIEAGCQGTGTAALDQALQERMAAIDAQAIPYAELVAKSVAGVEMPTAVVRISLLRSLRQVLAAVRGELIREQTEPTLAASTPAQAIDHFSSFLLQPGANGHQRLARLGEHWARARLTAPPIIAMPDLEKARIVDLAVEILPWVGFAPDLLDGVAVSVRSADAPLALREVGAEVLELLAGIGRGEQAAVHGRIARIKSGLPELLALYELPAQWRPAAEHVLFLLERVTAGQWPALLEEVVPLVEHCAGHGLRPQECIERLPKDWMAACDVAGREESADACRQGRLLLAELLRPVNSPALRLYLADIALELGLHEHVGKLLARPPDRAEVDDPDLQPLYAGMHLNLIARLALAEGDAETAATAHARARERLGALPQAVQENPEFQQGQDLLSLRLDIASGRPQEARESLGRLRGKGGGLPRANRIAFEEELAVAEQLLDPSPAAAAQLGKLQAQELQQLHTAARGGDRGFIRALLSMRAARRDRILALALTPEAQLPELAWQESAWFKGIAEQLAESTPVTAIFQPAYTEVQSRMGKGAVVLDFAAFARVEFPSQRPGHRHLLVSVLAQSGKPRLYDLGPYAPVQQAIDHLRQAIADEDAAVAQAAQDRLHALLLAPVSAQLRDARRIVLIPDAGLFLLPFELLRAPAGLKPDVSLQVAASLREVMAAPASRAGQGVVIVAAPDFGPEPDADAPVRFTDLPGARSEGQTLRRVWSAQTVTLLSGADATESAFRNIQAPRLLHLATHGYALAGPDRAAVTGSRGLAVVASVATPTAPSAVTGKGGALDIGGRVLSRALNRYEDPLARVGIAMAGANRELTGPPEGRNAGIIDGREVVQLQLRGTDLVVLSACETAVGQTADGDAVGSLQRAFHLAGARHVMATLWPIDDEASAAFMAHFHHRLKAGGSPRSALTAAQAHLRNIPEWSAPRYWAAFQLSGPATTE